MRQPTTKNKESEATFQRLVEQNLHEQGYTVLPPPFFYLGQMCQKYVRLFPDVIAFKDGELLIIECKVNTSANELAKGIGQLCMYKLNIQEMGALFDDQIEKGKLKLYPMGWSEQLLKEQPKTRHDKITKTTFTLAYPNKLREKLLRSFINYEVGEPFLTDDMTAPPNKFRGIRL